MDSTELKLESVQKYETGTIDLKALSKKYHVDDSQVRHWKDTYFKHDAKEEDSIYGNYTGNFKVAVITELRQKFKLTALLEYVGMPRNTYYYYLRKLKESD